MMSSSEAAMDAPTPLENFNTALTRVKRQYQQALDRVTPHVLHRWIATACIVSLFELRIVVSQGVCSFPAS
ncbi:hypothetical protein OF83DRAFT_1155903 [Amylostereum chailletii]|nr:hypothetical protein OF83DRAFT_1155903 [Amylostereum chailletii]